MTHYVVVRIFGLWHSAKLVHREGVYLLEVDGIDVFETILLKNAPLVDGSPTARKLMSKHGATVAANSLWLAYEKAVLAERAAQGGRATKGKMTERKHAALVRNANRIGPVQEAMLTLLREHPGLRPEDKLNWPTPQHRRVLDALVRKGLAKVKGRSELTATYWIAEEEG
jgi:hypothetical protein